MKIPSNRNWTQLNQGEDTGVLYDTHNISLDTRGQLKLARRPVAVASSQTTADFGHPVAVVYFDNNYFIVTEEDVFIGGLLGSLFTRETDFTPNVTQNSDAIVFNGRLVVTLNNNIADFDGDTNDRYTLGALTASVPHPMTIFDSNPTYKLAIGNGNQVKTYDTSYNANPTILTLPPQFTVTSLKYRNGFLYVGTKTTDGSEARIFIWNGSGTSAQYECPVGCEWVYSMVEYGPSVAAVVSSGQLIQVSGSQFIEIAAFPVYYQPHLRWQGTSSRPKVVKNGMRTIGDTIYINIEGLLDEGFLESMRSGLWAFSPTNGLYHYANISTDQLVNDNTLTVSNDIITTSAAHNLKTGDAVELLTVSGLSGVSIDFVYYVTVVATNQIKLSHSRAALVKEEYVPITGTPTTSDILVYFPNTDAGWRFSRSGAIAATTVNESTRPSLSSEILWCGRAENAAGTTVFALNAFHDSNTVGSFTTTRIYTDQIQDVWKDLYAFIDGLVTDNDKLTIKMQTKTPKYHLSYSGTWASSTVINTASAHSATADIAVGDEIVFMTGVAQGRTANITAVSRSSGTTSLTLSQALGTTGQAATFYTTNVREVGRYGVGHKKNEFLETAIIGNNKSPWIKIKVVLEGTDMTVNMLELPNNVHKGA